MPDQSAINPDQQMPTEVTKPFRLLDLRLQIYDHAIPEHSSILYVSKGSVYDDTAARPRRSGMTALLCSCRLVYREVSPIVFDNTQLALRCLAASSDPSDFFLGYVAEAVPCLGRLQEPSALRLARRVHLMIDQFDAGYQQVLHKLMEQLDQCRAVKQLSIKVYAS